MNTALLEMQQEEQAVYDSKMANKDQEILKLQESLRKNKKKIAVTQEQEAHSSAEVSTLLQELQSKDAALGKLKKTNPDPDRTLCISQEDSCGLPSPSHTL